MSCRMSSNFKLVLILCAFSNLQAADYPSDLPQCYRDDKNLNECLLNATEIIRPKLQLGIEEFGIPPINPHVVPEVILQQGSKALSFKMTLRNLTITGFDTYKFTKFDFDPKTLTFEITIEFGPILTSSNCLFEGHLLLTNLNGTGRLLLETEGTNFHTTITGILENRNGTDYYKMQDISVITPKKSSGKARFENFLGVNDNIVKAINKVLEENADELMSEVFPIFINFVEDFVDDMYSEVFERFPYDTLLPLSS